MMASRRSVIYSNPKYKQFSNNSSSSSDRTRSDSDQYYFETNSDRGYLLFDMEDVSIIV